MPAYVLGLQEVDRFAGQQAIRVHGTEGYVEILPAWAGASSLPSRDGAWRTS